MTDTISYAQQTEEEALASMAAILAQTHVPASAIANSAVANSAVANSAVTAPAARSVADLLKHASDRQNRVLAGVWSFNVAADGAEPHVVTTTLDTGGQFAMLKIKIWAGDNVGVEGAALPYSNVDFTATSLSVAEAQSLVAQTTTLDLKSYAILNDIAAGVKAVPATITTTDAIDAAFAALVA
jgi:hypothetical protein